MTCRFRIVELGSHLFVITHQDRRTGLWHCAKIRACSARIAALCAYRLSQVKIYFEVDQAIKDILAHASSVEIGFEPQSKVPTADSSSSLRGQLNPSSENCADSFLKSERGQI